MPYPGTFFSRTSPEGAAEGTAAYEVVMHRAADAPPARRELGERDISTTDALVLGHFTMQIFPEQWVDVGEVIVGPIDPSQ
ncbi:MAG TPA: hypothetical protein PKA02_04095 [Candidatus Saccharibacteria bacterium]|nr:hypothetical protein [Candidatus Saccharibacteria bacterium]